MFLRIVKYLTYAKYHQTPCRAERPQQGIDFQEKEAQKD